MHGYEQNRQNRSKSFFDQAIRSIAGAVIDCGIALIEPPREKPTILEQANDIANHAFLDRETLNQESLDMINSTVKECFGNDIEDALVALAMERKKITSGDESEANHRKFIEFERTYVLFDNRSIEDEWIPQVPERESDENIDITPEPEWIKTVFPFNQQELRELQVLKTVEQQMQSLGNSTPRKILDSYTHLSERYGLGHAENDLL